MLAAPSAYADNALRPEQIPAKAKELATRGRAYHDAGDYSMAVAAFKEAYVLAPSPGLLVQHRAGVSARRQLRRSGVDVSPLPRHESDREPIATSPSSTSRPSRSAARGGLRMAVDPAEAFDAEGAAAVGASLGMAAAGAMVTSQQVDEPSLDRAHTYKRYGIVVGVGGGAALARRRRSSRCKRVTRRRPSRTSTRTAASGPTSRTTTRAASAMRPFAKVLGIGGGVAVASGAILYALGHHYESEQADHGHADRQWRAG